MSRVHHVLAAPQPAGLFDTVCDACFVLLCCEASGWAREPSIRATLRELRPCARTELYFFKGGSGPPPLDLALNLLHLFEEACSRGYRRVLVLEDDAEVHPAFRASHAAEVAAFVRRTDPEVYGLGNHATPTPLTVWAKHQKAAFGFVASAHAMLYSSAYMQKVLRRQAELLSRNPHYDTWPQFLRAQTYRFHVPLVVQKFPRTANRDAWDVGGPTSALARGAKRAALRGHLAFIRATKLDTQVEPGWSLVYWLGCLPACALWMVAALAALAAAASA
jgi:hypothetical protein